MNSKKIYDWLFLSFLFLLGLVPEGLGQNVKINDKAYENLEINPLNWLNTPYLEFSPGFYQDGFFYIASGEKDKEYDKELNESFFEIRFEGIEKMDDSLASYISSINKQSIHKGPGSFTLDDSCFYFTIENRNPAPGRESTLKISCISNETGDWLSKELPFEQLSDYSYCHPSANSLNDQIIFASDMPGGYGGMDLYMIEKMDSIWSEPMNLGSRINTEENELFPYLYDDQHLFFASDRKNGFGGLDIYLGDLTTNETQILRAPFNSAKDDFGILLSEDSYSGFFSSSRLGDNAKDDIFQFKLQSPLLVGKEESSSIQIDFLLWVRDFSTGYPLAGVKAYVNNIELDCSFLNIDGYEIEILENAENEDGITLRLKPKPNFNDQWLYQTDSLGILKIPVDVGSKYIFSLRKKGFGSQELILNPSTGKLPKDIFMIPLTKEGFEMEAIPPKPDTVDPILKEILKSYELPAPLITLEKGEVVVLNHIYYDYNSTDIKKGEARELDGLARQMKQNPGLIIELGAHTDSRGDNDYNLALSEARAQAAKDYLVEQGILSTRIISIGFGEKKLINHCAEGIICSESEHQMNRRTEVKVLDN